jgi:phosphoribosylamine---glycine ligase
MRVLGITETCDLGSLYMRLVADGHDVRVSVSEPLASGTMKGLVPRVEDWRSELDWVGKSGLILFEAVGFGELQDDLRSKGFKVIGGSAFGDRLEDDRAYAQSLLESFGMKVALSVEFDVVDDAVEDLRQRPRRCVLKTSASAGDTFVGMMPDGSDVIAMLRACPRAGNLILMDHIAGVETGVGAYFNGERFLRPACLDWEHKHFFAGDMGELTGEMGTVATFDGSETLFEVTLAPLEPMLCDAGHVGWVNLNMIVNEDGVWPLEFTCRFGYPGFAVLEPLQAVRWAELFRSMLDRSTERLPTVSGYSVAVVLSTPPFPYTRKDVEAPVGLPVIVEGVEPDHLHLGEVGRGPDGLVTAGLYGWTAVVTGTAHSVVEAQRLAYERAAKMRIPNVRYRLDIGDKLIAGQLQALTDWGWMKSMPSSRIASQMVR